MTDAEWDALGAYIDELRAELLLQAWHIVIERDPPGEPSAEAETFVRREASVATMRFCHDFRTFEPERQRQIVLHELVHLFTDQFASDCDDVLEELASKSTYDAVHVLWQKQYERMNDAIAAAVAPRFPLIAWPS